MFMKWKWFVYIIQCKDNSYYTGFTWNIGDRLEQHISLLGGEYTSKHGVKKLVYAEEHFNYEGARQRELQIKGWTRKKKEMLINGVWSNV